MKIIGIRDACSTADIFNNFQPLLGQFFKTHFKDNFFGHFFLGTFLGHFFGTLVSGHLVWDTFLETFFHTFWDTFWNTIVTFFWFFFVFFGHFLGHIFGHFQHLAVPHSALPWHRLPLSDWLKFFYILYRLKCSKVINETRWDRIGSGTLNAGLLFCTALRC